MARTATGAEFREALERSSASPSFFEQFARFEPFDRLIDQDAAIHDGTLATDGVFRAPALCTLVTGNVAAGIVDLSAGFDAGGLFIVLGDVTCRHFIGHYGVQCFIDGDIAATGAILTGFEDSSMSVIGTLRTRLFVGADIVCEVGCGADIDYGIGCCAPLGYERTGEPFILPRHGEDEAARIVAVAREPTGFALDVEKCADLVRSGRPLFR